MVNQCYLILREQSTEVRGVFSALTFTVHLTLCARVVCRQCIFHNSPKTLVNEEEPKKILQVGDDDLLTHFCKSEQNRGMLSRLAILHRAFI